MSAKVAQRLVVAALLAATLGAAIAAHVVSRDIAEEEREDRIAIAREATLDALAAREEFLGDLSALAVQPDARDELLAFARIQEREEDAVVSVEWVPRSAAAPGPVAALLIEPDARADRDLATSSENPLAGRIARRAMLAGHPVASPPLELSGGDPGFYLAMPAGTGGAASGALVALVDGRAMLDAELSSAAPAVAIEDAGTPVATLGGQPEDPEAVAVGAHGRTWTVSVAGSPLSTFERIVPWAILLSGFALALVVAILFGRAVSKRDAALELARRREEELEQRSREDELTGIFNRRHFTETLTASLAERGERRLAAVLLDLDHFKEINDNHGHLTGDLVLQVAAQRLAAVVRPTETLARWGGEEFAVLARDLDRDGALALGERLRAAIAGAPIEVKDELIELRASVGISLTDGRERDPDAVVGAADQALYEAKAAGRNRVVVAAPRGQLESAGT